MRLRLIRHATLAIEYKGKRLMVDPMLDDAGARPAIQNSPNPRNNPLVPLPVSPEQLVKEVDGVFVTHTQRPLGHNHGASFAEGSRAVRASGR